MKYNVRFSLKVCVLFIVISVYVNRSTCTKLTPCGNIPSNGESNTNDGKWFKWGRLYSFCMQNYNVTGNSSTFDHECNTTKCKECISVCYNSKNNKTLYVCEQGCKTEPCKIGCRFYDHLFNKKGNFTLDESNIPKPNPDTTVVGVIQNEENVTFQWTPVESHGNIHLSSIYLLTIRAKIPKTAEREPEYILGLVQNPTYTAIMEDMCNHVYHGYKYKYTNLKFALRVYPINFNGPTTRMKDVSFISKYTHPTKVLPIKNLTIARGSPYFQKSYNIIWKIKWFKPMDNRSIGVRYRFNIPSCGDTDRKLTILKLNKYILDKYQDGKADGYGIVDVRNTKQDDLATCKVKIEVAVKYGKCFLSEPVFKTINYTSCKEVSNYPNPCPILTPTAPIDTLLTNITFGVVGKTCNYTNKACEADHSTTCTYCQEIKYHIPISWKHLDIPYVINGYTVRWGEYSVFIKKSDKVLVPSSNTSYVIEISHDEKPFTLGIQVHAETNNSLKSWHFNTPSGTKYLKVPDPKPIPTKPPPNANPSTTSTIIAVVAILLVFVAIGAIFKVYRNRLMQQRETKSNISDEIYMTPEKAIIADEWEIYPSNIKVNEKIGEGTFGTVYSATVDNNVLIKSKFAKQCGGVALMNDRAKTVAVKFLKEGAQDQEDKDFQDEILLMKGIGYHKNIVNMVGCSTIKQPLCLIVEYMQHGDLLHYMRKQRSKELNSQSNDNHANKSLCVDKMMSFSWQIACGMEYLATNNVVHRDLAARNILVGADKNVKISDFGLSRQITNEPIYVSNSKTRKLPVKWMSVEAIYHKEFTVASDVWAYGVVLFEIVTVGGAPYPFIANRELCKMLKSGYRMEKPDNCAGEMYDIMLHCWNEIPAQRPTFTELREHLEKIMEQGAQYFSFEIDDSKAYYNVASFKSIPSDDEEETLFTKEYDEKPIQVIGVKSLPAVDAINITVDDILKEKLNSEDPNDENETARYISPQSLKSFTDIEKSVSFDNPNFHFHE